MDCQPVSWWNRIHIKGHERVAKGVMSTDIEGELTFGKAVEWLLRNGAISTLQK